MRGRVGGSASLYGPWSKKISPPSLGSLFNFYINIKMTVLLEFTLKPSSPYCSFRPSVPLSGSHVLTSGICEDACQATARP